MNIEIEQNVHLVFEAAELLTLIVQSCGKISFEEQSNDFIFPANFQTTPSLTLILVKLLKKGRRDLDLLEHLQYHSNKIANSKAVSKLASTSRMFKLILLLLELEQLDSSLFADGGAITRFSSPTFIATLTALLEMETVVLIDVYSPVSEQRQSYSRIRLILALISRLVTDSIDEASERGLSAAMRKTLDLKPFFSSSPRAPKDSLTPEHYIALQKIIESIPMRTKVTSSAALLLETEAELSATKVRASR